MQDCREGSESRLEGLMIRGLVRKRPELVRLGTETAITNQPLAWAMWGLAAAAYVLSLFHRMSLSVAGLAAEQRFGIGPASLALLSVVQLALYGALQLPVGRGADRLGPKRMLLLGLTLLTTGSALFA